MLSGACNGVSAMDINGERHCRGPKQGRFCPPAPTRAREFCSLRTWRAHVYIVRARPALYCLPGIAAGQTACLKARSLARPLGLSVIAAATG
jgi:hypothetical protein